MVAKKCHQCGNDVRCTIGVGSKQGFAHRVCIDCDAYEMNVDHVYTSGKTEDEYDVNVRMVAFIRSHAKGFEAPRHKAQ